jgi:formylglycine-generating enzyme required for sulfatase activity
LPGLSAIRIGGYGNSDNLKYLAEMPAIRTLSLIGRWFEDKHLAHIKDMRNLEMLGLEESGLDGSGLSSLQNLKNLKVLYFRASQHMGDYGLKHISQLPLLESVMCQGVALTDAGLRQLEVLKTLKQIDLTGTKVTLHGMTRFKQALPDCKIKLGTGDFELPDPKKATAPPPAVVPFDTAQAKAHQQAWADYLGEPVETMNSIGMKLAVIPPGSFKMGEGDNVVNVTLTKPFRLGIHEVTQGQWKTVMETEPWGGQKRVQEGKSVPATFVNWTDATEFCLRLTARERGAGKLPEGWEYQLPTDAEWEWACRSGTTTTYSFGDDESQLGEYAWYETNTNNVGEAHAHAVGLKRPNGWGLHDVHGNVWEWCRDWRGPAGKLEGGTDPVGPWAGSIRVPRGGSWSISAENCRSANRGGNDPSLRLAGLGFRVVLSPVAKKPPPLAVAPFGEAQAKAHQQAWAKHLGTTVVTVDGVGQRMVLVPPGEFLMGSTDGQVASALQMPGDSDPFARKRLEESERPQHVVKITRPLRMGATEVTVGQFRKFVQTTGYVTVLEENGLVDPMGAPFEPAVIAGFG